MLVDDERTNKILPGFLFFLFIHFCIFGVALLIWNVFWLKKFGYTIYKPKTHERQPSALGNIERTQNEEKTTHFSYWKYVFMKLWNFERRFWQALSPDAYLYLKLQQSLLKLCLIFCLVSISLSFLQTNDISSRPFAVKNDRNLKVL